MPKPSRLLRCTAPRSAEMCRQSPARHPPRHAGHMAASGTSGTPPTMMRSAALSAALPSRQLGLDCDGLSDQRLLQRLGAASRSLAVGVDRHLEVAVDPGDALVAAAARLVLEDEDGLAAGRG